MVDFVQMYGKSEETIPDMNTSYFITWVVRASRSRGYTLSGILGPLGASFAYIGYSW